MHKSLLRTLIFFTATVIIHQTAWGDEDSKEYALFKHKPSPRNNLVAVSQETVKEKKEKQAHQNQAESNIQETQDFNSGVTVFGEYIYWQPFGTNLVYANEIKDFPTTSLRTYSAREILKYDWQSGFRTGLGYMWKNGWRTDVQYTWLHPSASTKKIATGTKAFMPNYYELFPGILAYTTVESRVDLHYHVVDWTFARRKEVGEHLLLTFLAGFKGAWFHQSWKTHFSQRIFVATGEILDAKNKWTTQGGGLQSGVGFSWNFWDGLNFYGKTSFAILLMHQKAKLFILRSQAAAVPDVDVAIKENKIIPTLDFEGGVSWRHKFHKKATLILSLGYQIVNWWDVNDNLVMGGGLNSISGGFDDNEAGNLALQGLVAHVGLDF